MATKSKNTFGDYYRKVMDHCAHWKELGVLLEVEPSELDVIERDRPRESKDCMVAMLDAWLKSKPRNPEKQLEDALLQQNGEKLSHAQLHACMHARTQAVSLTAEATIESKRRASSPAHLGAALPEIATFLHQPRAKRECQVNASLDLAS